MRSFSSAFMESNVQRTRSPRIAAKVTNSTGVFWLVSHADIATGATQYEGIMATGLTTQTIEPEKGVSVLGGMDIATRDNGLTARLRAILSTNDTIVGDKVELWIGYEEMAFVDYQLLATYWVDGVDNTFDSYVIRLIDTQRFIKRSVFSKKSTQLFGSFTSTGTLTEIAVVSTAGFEMVAHDSDWADEPNSTVGYVKIKGVDSDGADVFEVLRYTGLTDKKFTGVTRGVLGTKQISAKGTADGNGAVSEVEEFIYLDLNIPKMILAVMTGDLYGQAGARLPSHWHAGLTADKVDLLSFELIGADLWAVPLSFMNPKPIDAKQFIASQAMRPANLFLKVDARGELKLKRFSAIYQKSAPDGYIDSTNAVSFSEIKREAKAIKNRFEILWEWRHDIEKHARRSIFIDQDSIDRNNFTSDILSIKMDGVRNRSQDIQHTLEQFAEGIRARYSNPAIKASATVFLSDAVQYEVGDLVLVSLPYPDYADTDTFETTMEIQGVSIDFAGGTSTLALFGTSGEPTQIDFEKGVDPTVINHTGWTQLPEGLTGSYTDAGGTLRITGTASLTGGATTASGRYWYDGNIIIETGGVLETSLNTTIDCNDISLIGNGTITSAGRGLNGGAGMPAGDTWTGVQGQQGFFGGKDNADEGIDSIWGFSGTKVSRDAWRPSSANVAAISNSVKGIILSINENDEIVGLPTTLMGSSGSGGARARALVNITGGKVWAAGGDGGKSGGGIVLVCDNLFADASAKIITNGGDGSEGGTTQQIYAGSGGSGFAGACVVLIKQSSSPIPILYANVESKSGKKPYGALIAGTTSYTRARETDAYLERDYTWLPYQTTAQAATVDADYRNSLYIARYIKKAGTATQVAGAGADGTCPPPTALALVYTPDPTSAGYGYITATATPPNDPDYSYTKFSYFKWEIVWDDLVIFDWDTGITVPVGAELVETFLPHDLNEENAFLVSRGEIYSTGFKFYARSVSKNGVSSAPVSAVIGIKIEAPFNPATVPNISVSDFLTSYAETVTTTLDVLVTDGGNNFVKQYEVEYVLGAENDGDSSYQNVGTGTNGVFRIPNVEDNGVYYIRARTLSFDGRLSVWRTVTYQVVGQTEPPENVTGLLANVLGNQVFLSWDAVGDLDLSHYRVRFSSATSGATYSNAQDLITKVARPSVSCFVPAMTGTYFVVAFDKLGLRSLEPAKVSITTDIAGIGLLNVVETITESPNFLGQRENVTVRRFGFFGAEKELLLDTATTFDLATGDFDLAFGLFDGGTGSVAAIGYYYFYNTLDLGAVFTSRISFDFDVKYIGYIDTFDSVSDNWFDSRGGLFDGSPDDFDETTASLEMRTTQDDPAGSPVWSEWQRIFVSDATARAFEWRVVMRSQDTSASPRITDLRVFVDMPDALQSGNDIVSAAAPYVATFDRPFKVLKAVGIATQNAQTGDYYNITAKSNTGFTVEFRNAAGALVSREFDYLAKGYGRGL
jgi:hypothetical protein